MPDETDDDGQPEPCRGCETKKQVSWSPLFGWLCARCQWQRTEAYFLRQRVTILPGDDSDARPAA